MNLPLLTLSNGATERREASALPVWETRRSWKAETAFVPAMPIPAALLRS